MTRGGRPDPRDGPERRCIATGETGPRAALVRFVVGPDDGIVPDVDGRLPGRGIWVAADRAALAAAQRRGAFARAARRPVTVPDGLPDLVETLLVRRLSATLSLAHKGGQAVAGYEKTRAALVAGRAAVLVQASDGSPRGRARLRPPAGGALVTCLTSAEMGLSFGRDHVIHAAVAAGGLARRVVEEAARLARLRGHDGGFAAAGERRNE